MTTSSTPTQWLHFIEIAGNAMSGVALAARDMGHKVTGSDVLAYPSATTELLESKGVDWWREPAPERLEVGGERVDLIIVSGVTTADFPELVWAREHNVPVISFAEFVGRMTAGEDTIVVAGTHGKTTTSSMIAWILESAGYEPDFMIGIKPRNFGASVRLDHGKVAVVEGDEYTASQLDIRPKFDFYHPTRLILTSLEMDHPDVYRDLADVTAHFQSMVGGLPAKAHLYKWVGSPALDTLEANPTTVAVGYGVEAGDWSAEEIRYDEHGLGYTLAHNGEPVGHLRVPLYGAHNVANSLAAAALLLDYGLTLDQIQHGLKGFLGAARRFQLVSDPSEPVRVYDDYAHHPTEVKATIAAARKHFGGKLIVGFRPHTYTRVETLLPEFQAAFGEADIAFVSDIESARELGSDHSVTGEDIVRAAGDQIYYEPDREEMIARLVAEARPGDTILMMSVSGYKGIAKEIAAQLADRPVEDAA